LTNNNQNSLQYEQIVFIDSSVEDYQTLIDNFAQSTDFVILDSQHDGVVQITNYLSQHNNLDAIHIVSHGDAGKLFLGNTELNQNTLSQYADILTGWNNFLKEDADILLYGCNVAADLSGTEFINNLSDYTQADILASNDKTGNSKLDGDWDLEYAVGKVEAELIFNSQVETEYGSALIVLDNNLTYLNNFLDTNFPVINFNTFDFDPSSLLNFNTNYRFDNPVGNTFLFNFSASSLKFDPINFDFTSLNINSDSLTFNLNNSAFDLNSIAKNSITFEFYKTEIEKFNYNSLFSFDASSVTFTNSAVTFKYKPSSLNFNADLFKANANLFEYKFTNFDNGVSFNQFNASDYRALEYAFKGDELFDTKYYLDKKVTPIGMNPFTHYQEYGFLAGIDPNPLFDVSYYLDKNIDVRNAKMDPLKHYALFGYTENQNNRDPNALFDSSYYNEKNQDVVLAKENPLLHYIAFGNTENFDNRDPNKIFDNSYYNENNPDVANSGMTALEHYLQFGWKESLPENPKFNPNRNPNPFFKPSDYFEINDDVRIASYKLPSANPVQHMLEFGFTENRITHKLFKSDNIFKVSQKVTANSEYFPLIQQQLNKSGIKLTPTSDGSIQVSQVTIGIDNKNPIIDYVGEKLEYVFWSFLVGGGITLVDKGSNFVVDQLWELTVDNFLTTPSAIEFDINYSFDAEPNNPFNTPPFEFPVSERVIEIFQPDNLIGTENIFITPPGTVNFPTNTASPQRDAILEDLLNGGLFIGGDVTIPQGTYVVTSNRDGDLVGYNPTVLGNSLPSDWDSRLQRQRIQLDLTQDPSINGQVIIPGRTASDPTHGLFYDPDGNTIQLRSGTIRSNVTNVTREEILNLYSGSLQDAVRVTFDHAEGNAASIIRQLNLPIGTIVINHNEGPCSFCQTGIPEILNDGQILEVIYSTDGGITLIKDTFTGGRSFNPNTDREIGPPFF
jgi:hypothetical protein